MKKLLLFLVAALCLLPFNSAVAGARSSMRPVALVFSLQGEATRKAPAQRWRPLRLFERLSAGTIVEVRPGSRLALAFANGHLYELGERSRATLGADDLAARSGPVRALPSAPLLPVFPIAEEENAGGNCGATIVRGESIQGLYPCGGAATFAAATVLRFAPVDGAGKYRIEVQDLDGALVFATETTDSSVHLPSEVLQPGRSYSWKVRTVERAGPVAEGGEARFVTLPARLAEAREALRRSIAAMGDPASLALLAEVDRSLGLRREARDELQAALRAAPEDAGLAASLARFERCLPYLQSP
jgi:hypothetical protein